MFTLPRDRAAPFGPLQLNPGHSLANGLVFAWGGTSGRELTTGIEPVNTKVQLVRTGVGAGWNVQSGNQGFSDLNFGTYAATADLHEHAATWAFFAMSGNPAGGVVTTTGLAAQNDGNTVNAGWQIYNDPSGGITLECERGTTNLQRIWNETWRPFAPQVLVVTYDGTNNVTGTAGYLDGIPLTIKSGHNGAGTTAAATTSSLYLGRRRFNSALSHSGDIYVALIANRVWAYDEIIGFTQDPWAALRPHRSTVYSFAKVVHVAPTAAVLSPSPGASTLGASLIFNVTAHEGFGTASAAITDSVVTSDPAWSLAGGFAAGYYGSTSAITDGFQVVLNRTGAWRTGALALAVSVTDAIAATASASSSWTMAAPVVPTPSTSDYIADAAMPLRPFYYLKITGLPYYFFSIIDPTDATWGSAQWTLGAGYSSVKGMDVPSDTFDQALPSLIGGTASAERVAVNMMDFDVVDANGAHSFFGRLLSPGRMTTNTSAVLGILTADLTPSTTSSMAVQGAAGAFGAADTFVGGETIGVGSATGPDGSGNFILSTLTRNKYPCHPGYPPIGNYAVPLTENGDVDPNQTLLVTQGDALTFVNRSAALYIGHMTPDGRPEPEANSLCRIVGHVKAISTGSDPGKYAFTIESVVSDLANAKLAPNLAHADLGNQIYLRPAAWRSFSVSVTGSHASGTQILAKTYTIDNGSGNTFFDAKALAEHITTQCGADPVILTIATLTYKFTISAYVAGDSGDKDYFGFRSTLPLIPGATIIISNPSFGGVTTVLTPPANPDVGILTAMGFPPQVALTANQSIPPTVAVAVAPRSIPICFIPTGSQDGTEIGLGNSGYSAIGGRFFTDQGDGSGQAFVRYGDGQTGQVLSTSPTTITVGTSRRSATLGWAPASTDTGGYYYVEYGGHATVDQIVRIPSKANGSAQKGLFQFLGSKGYDNDGEFNVFPPGVGLGLIGILDTTSIEAASFRFTSSFIVDIDSTTMFTDIWTAMAKEQGMFLVWDPATTKIALRSLALANYINAAAFALTESNRASTDDRSVWTVDQTNLRTGWVVKYGWDPIQQKFLSADLTVNDSFASMAYQISSRTETIEDRTIPLAFATFVTDTVVPSLLERSVYTRYPWASVTRSVNKTGLLLSPGVYHPIADNTLINPFTGRKGIALTDNVYGFVMRVQSTLNDGMVTVTFLIDQTTDGSTVRPWSPTGMLLFSGVGTEYNNTTGVCMMAAWYTKGDHDGVDFQVGDKVSLTTLDNEGAPAYVKNGTVSAVATDGTTVTIDAGLGAISTTRETIMILQDWGSQVADRKTGAHRTSFQGDGVAILIDGTDRLHKWT